MKRYENYTSEVLAEELSKIATDLEKKKLNDKAIIVRYAVRRIRGLSSAVSELCERG